MKDHLRSTNQKTPVTWKMENEVEVKWKMGVAAMKCVMFIIECVGVQRGNNVIFQLNH